MNSFRQIIHDLLMHEEFSLDAARIVYKLKLWKAFVFSQSIDSILRHTICMIPLYFRLIPFDIVQIYSIKHISLIELSQCSPYFPSCVEEIFPTR